MTNVQWAHWLYLPNGYLQDKDPESKSKVGGVRMYIFVYKLITGIVIFITIPSSGRIIILTVRIFSHRLGIPLIALGLIIHNTEGWNQMPTSYHESKKPNVSGSVYLTVLTFGTRDLSSN